MKQKECWQENIPVAAGDPWRPVAHIKAPSNWMNDPNGPFYADGCYHLFYQFNPCGVQWGCMHWGHLRSCDLRYWEDLPIALVPEYDNDEEHVFSGCSLMTKSGKPVILYTSIGENRPPQIRGRRGAEDWSKFVPVKANPLLEITDHGSITVEEWRDPFVYEEGDRKFMVVGGGLHGRGCVFLYESSDPEALEWHYRGILFSYPEAMGSCRNVECPNFIRLSGDKWLLLISDAWHVQYFIGIFDAEKGTFSMEKSGLVDGGNFYASNLCRAADGKRWLLWGWACLAPERPSWCGVLNTVREIFLTEDGSLGQRPAREVYDWQSLSAIGQTIAVQASSPAKRFRIELVNVEDEQVCYGAEVDREQGILRDGKNSVGFAPTQQCTLELIADRTLVEIFVNDQGAISCWLDSVPPEKGYRWRIIPE